MKKIIVVLLTLLMLSACGSKTNEENGITAYKIGICNYVDDASLNQIIASIEEEFESIEKENPVKFDIEVENCNADQAVLEQIIANFIYDDVDLMIGVATPVAIAMQTATEDNEIPVVFAAVSDPEGCKLVNSLDNPGYNITGTSDYLNADAIFDLIFALDPETDFVGLLYDPGQNSSTTPIKAAKAYLDNKNIKYKEYTGTNTSEITLAVSNVISDKPDALFTPTDNTVMTAELSIYEVLANAGIKQYCGADSFALNGAFVGYGVDYILLGNETAKTAADILLNDKDPSSYKVKTFDNGIVTLNTEICEQLGLDVETVKEVFAPLSTSVKEIVTAEEFE